MTDTVLIEKREELKCLLANSKTLIDAILDRTGYVVQKLTRRPHPVSFWYSAAVICLLILLVSSVISIFLREYNVIRREIVPIEILGTTLAFASLVIFKVFINNVFSNLRDNILDTITSEASLDDLRHWLGLLCNIKLHLAFSLSRSKFS